jgi:probable F420-dependent oxidoreductase
MKFGLSASFPWHGPPIVDLARHIEACGFESMWTGEHIIIPVDIADPQRFGVPLPDNYKHMPALFVAMTAAAVATTKLVFGMDVCLISQRNPLILAKEVATLDRISGGRLVFGVGHGWIEEESEIMGVPFKRRVKRATETVRALKVLWTEEKPSFSGEFINFPAVYCYPKPLQKPHPPVLIGSGNDKSSNTPILKRVAAIADGWLPANLTPQQVKDQLKELKEFCDAEGRDFSKMDITLLMPAVYMNIGERPPWALAGSLGAASDLIPQYAEYGVTRLVVGLDDMTDQKAFHRIEEAAKGLGLKS